MICNICKKEITEYANSNICSERCDKIRKTIIYLIGKYTPTHGCANCWGDLHVGCSQTCSEEFEKAREFSNELYFLIRL